jgi:HemY protein
MIRGLWFIAQLALIVLLSVWLAEQKGPVSIEWHGRLIETSVGVLLLALVVGAAILLVLWRIWRAIVGTPHAISRFHFRRRRDRGRVAIIRALSAIAAGDGATALARASEAEAIGEPAVAHLAAAQAAELAGDTTRAEAEYGRLAGRPDTALIGLRGLMGLSERRGDLAKAVELARQARKVAPKSPWVALRLSELEAQAGDLAEAERTLAAAAKLGALQAEEADRRLAALLLARAEKSAEAGDASDALADAERAHTLDPALGGAAILAARLMARSGRIPAAERILSETWAVAPSAALAHAWIRLAPKGDVTQRLRQAERLHALDRNDFEGRLALAEVEMASGRWAEARTHLAAVVHPGDARYCHLMAYLESASGNEAAARSWLERSLAADEAEARPLLPTAA